MYEELLGVSGNWRKENKFCSMWVQPYRSIILIFLKSFINRINKSK